MFFSFLNTTIVIIIIAIANNIIATIVPIPIAATAAANPATMNAKPPVAIPNIATAAHIAAIIIKITTIIATIVAVVISLSSLDFVLLLLNCYCFFVCVSIIIKHENSVICKAKRKSP